MNKIPVAGEVKYVIRENEPPGFFTTNVSGPATSVQNVIVEATARSREKSLAFALDKYVNALKQVLTLEGKNEQAS